MTKGYTSRYIDSLLIRLCNNLRAIFSSHAEYYLCAAKVQLKLMKDPRWKKFGMERFHLN